MTITAINLLRAEMLVRGYKANDLGEKMREEGYNINGQMLKTMVSKRRIPALLFIQCLSFMKVDWVQMPTDLSELT